MARPNNTANLLVIEMAMHFSILIYVFVLFSLAHSAGTWASGWVLKPENQMLLYVFVALSFASSMLVVMAPKFVANKKTAESGLNPGAPAEGIFLDYSQTDGRVNKITIMRMAFAESIAIYGFILAFLNQAAWLVLPFAVLALALQVIFGPAVGKMMGNA